jgi:4a-hydroxytetrahydrobiopterin dehydratase
VSALPARCTPCRKGTAPLGRAEAEERLPHVPNWTLDFPRLRRAFELADFVGALAWTNRVGQLAEQEGHHPDFHLTGWKRLELVLSTHAIGGLSDNDFVLARAIDRAWERFQDGVGSPGPR